MRITRQELYDRIWSTPCLQLAIRFGISDVGLAKVCKRYRIPRPPRGYWAKVQAGHSTKRTPLPKIADPRYEAIDMKGWDMPNDPIHHETTLRGQQATVSSSTPTVQHPLTEIARRQLAAARPDHDGVLHTDPATAPDLRVSAALVDRSLVMFNALATRWEASGGSIDIGVIGPEKRPTTTFAVGSDAFHVRIAEGIDESKPITDPLHRTGNPIVWITGDEKQQFRRRWAETKSQRFEKMLRPLIDTLLHAIETKKMDRLDAECIGRQEEKVRLRRNALAKDENREFYWRQSLMQQTEQWHEARRIREYLAALKQAIESGEWHFTDEQSGKEWFQWATRYADSIDPLTISTASQYQADGPTNTPVGDLDMTSHARRVVAQLEIKDTDGLWKVTEDQVRSTHASGPVWKEFNRVLEGLGYDVSKRQRDYYYW